MAESSGFFQAMIDENTGDYDRKYLAREFANYFALFVKNGVFGSPTNQLKVVPGNGLSISVSPGNAFIKGMWYNNSSNKNIAIVPNYSSSNRIDTVRVRMDDLARVIKADVYTGDTDLVRTEDTYDLQVATIVVKPSASTITDAEITDTRPNESVCGFVTQLLSVQTTEDLFAQYQAMFNQWFANVKNQLSTDAAGNLQNQIDEITPVIQPLVRNTISPSIVSKIVHIGENGLIYNPTDIEWNDTLWGVDYTYQASSGGSHFPVGPVFMSVQYFVYGNVSETPMYAYCHVWGSLGSPAVVLRYFGPKPYTVYGDTQKEDNPKLYERWVGFRTNSEGKKVLRIENCNVRTLETTGNMPGFETEKTSNGMLEVGDVILYYGYLKNTGKISFPVDHT